MHPSVESAIANGLVVEAEKYQAVVEMCDRMERQRAWLIYRLRDKFGVKFEAELEAEGIVDVELEAKEIAEAEKILAREA